MTREPVTGPSSEYRRMVMAPADEQESAKIVAFPLAE
jgi:hypothetical protein